jgi:hypothetical protein
MTVVVWDGNVLATDRQAEDGTLKWESSKAWVVSSEMYGACVVSGVGYLQDIVLSREWIRRGANPDDWPLWSKGQRNNAQVVVMTRDKLFLYDGTPYPIEREAPCAFGHGREVAYGAMYMGANAEMAVQAANKYAQHCGLGVEVFSLKENDNEESK